MIHHSMPDKTIIRCFEGCEGAHLRVIRDRLRYRHAQLEEARAVFVQPLDYDDFLGHLERLHQLQLILDRNPY